MPPQIEFLFDYASPYSFLANESLATQFPGATIIYRPVYLRGFEPFAKGLPYGATKLAYLIKDLQRCAQDLGVEVNLPAVFPINGLYALRGAIAAQRAGTFDAYHRDMFRAVWQRRGDVGSAEAVEKLSGVSLADPTIKDELRANTEAAMKRDVFGLPTFFVGDELFWGHDRMHQVARAANLAR